MTMAATAVLGCACTCSGASYLGHRILVHTGVCRMAHKHSLTIRAGPLPRHYASCNVPCPIEASPCPPPPPPIYDPADCPALIPIIGGRQSSCWSNDCSFWGASKTYDSKVYTWLSLAHTWYDTNPYFQLNLGTFTGNVSAVRIYGRSDCCVYQGQNLNVYVSATTNFNGAQSALCAAGVGMTKVGDVITVLCPQMPWTAKYVTVMRNVTNDVLSLQEIQPLYDGG